MSLYGPDEPAPPKPKPESLRVRLSGRQAVELRQLLSAHASPALARKMLDALNHTPRERRE
jgi:hypothetical protein